MDEKQLQALYNEVKDRMELGTFEQFKSLIINDSKFRIAFYNEASTFLEIGDFSSFEEKFRIQPSTDNDNGWWKKNKNKSGGEVGGGVGNNTSTKGDPKDIKSYPPCIQKFGNPTPGKREIFSVDGTGKYKGLFFFNNGRYSDGKTIMTYSCGADGTLTLAAPTKPTSVSKPKSSGIRYKPCTNLPCQFGTKNPKIREIQTCLGFPLKWQTGNFGPITRKGLKDLQYDISKGITDEIYNTIKQNCGSSNTTTPDHPPLNPSGNQPSTDNSQPEFKDQDQLGVGRQ